MPRKKSKTEDSDNVFNRRSNRRRYEKEEEESTCEENKNLYHLRLIERNNKRIFMDDQVPFTNFIMFSMEEPEMTQTIEAVIGRYFPAKLLQTENGDVMIMKENRTAIDIAEPIKTIFNEKKRGIILFDFAPMLQPATVRLTEQRFVAKAYYLRELYNIPNWFVKSKDGERIFMLLNLLRDKDLHTQDETELVETQAALLHVTTALEIAEKRPKKAEFSTRNKCIVALIVMLLLIFQFLYQIIKYGEAYLKGEDLSTWEIPDPY